MHLLAGWAFSYERGTPVQGYFAHRRRTPLALPLTTPYIYRAAHPWLSFSISLCLSIYLSIYLSLSRSLSRDEATRGAVAGYLAQRRTPTPLGPQAKAYGRVLGVALSYERGTPVAG